MVNRLREIPLVWLADQQMHVLGHYDISIDSHSEATARGFKTDREQVIDRRLFEARLAAVTTERYEVGLPGFVEATEATRHGGTLYHPRLASKIGTRTWGTMHMRQVSLCGILAAPVKFNYGIKTKTNESLQPILSYS